MNTTTVSLHTSADFMLHELPFAQLADRVYKAKGLLLCAMPDAAAIINAGFGCLEDDIAELPTGLASDRNLSGERCQKSWHLHKIAAMSRATVSDS